MRAAWYDRQGPAGEVLEVGELPAPVAGRGRSDDESQDEDEAAPDNRLSKEGGGDEGEEGS